MPGQLEKVASKVVGCSAEMPDLAPVGDRANFTKEIDYIFDTCLVGRANISRKVSGKMN